MKPYDKTMELTFVDSTSWCDDKPPQFRFYTRGTESRHDWMLGKITCEKGVHSY
jgi:hypothetical protein